ncbi:MAG: UvrD-helicase domain-containing protein, partial [Deltaproteobacteria bacterium]|nr:UvrD-helicase domain-containing protein [Deltaproteobacteria bacterium]
MDLSSLTPSQEQAVRHRGSPLIVMAGPGTGKTRTLTYRIAHLIETRAARPDQILAITFTNKAAEEMQFRIDQLCRWIESPAPPWISTFHGFCFRFLRENLSIPFQLLSENEALALLKETMRQQFPDFPARSLKELARRISWAKNSLILPDSPETLPPWDVYPRWSSFYRAYQEKLAAQKLWDFDELLIQAVILLERNPALKTSVQSRYPFVFIDEFQDVNFVQYRLFQLLTRENGEWMVIGDSNQAIYGFRGASADFFSRLKLDRPSLTEITLKETFRLNQTVLTASSQVMQGTARDLISIQKGGASLPVIGLASAEDEGEYLTR